jgi:hypothetical protein
MDRQEEDGLIGTARGNREPRSSYFLTRTLFVVLCDCYFHFFFVLPGSRFLSFCLAVCLYICVWVFVDDRRKEKTTGWGAGNRRRREEEEEPEKPCKMPIKIK